MDCVRQCGVIRDWGRTLAVLSQEATERVRIAAGGQDPDSGGGEATRRLSSDPLDQTPRNSDGRRTTDAARQL